MQRKFAEEGHEKLLGLQRYFDNGVRDDYAAGQLDAGRGRPTGDA